MAQKPPITIKHTQTITKTVNPEKGENPVSRLAILLVSNVPSFQQQEKQTHKPKSIVYTKKQDSLTLSKKKVNQ